MIRKYFLSGWVFLFIVSACPLIAQNNQIEPGLKEQLLNLPKPAQFKEHLTRLAAEPHRAGTPANRQVANYIATVMKEAGMSVKEYPYDIYMPLGPGKVDISLITPLRMPLAIQEDILHL